MEYQLTAWGQALCPALDGLLSWAEQREAGRVTLTRQARDWPTPSIAEPLRPMDIIYDRPEHLADLIRLNELWIEEHFALEDVDRALAADPGTIGREGGHTICAIEDGRVVGAVALFRRDDDHFELARMAIDPTYRRRGIGRALALSAIEKAAERGAKRITLLSNLVLGPAIALYRSLGFRVVREGQHPEYARCNIIMEKTLGE